MAVFAALAKKVYDQGYLPLPGYNLTRTDAEDLVKTIAPLALTALAPKGFTRTAQTIEQVLSSTKIGSRLKKILRHEANVSSFRRRQAYVQHAIHNSNRRYGRRQRFLRRVQEQQHRFRRFRSQQPRRRQLHVYSNRNQRMRGGRQRFKSVRPFIRSSRR